MEAACAPAPGSPDQPGMGPSVTELPDISYAEFPQRKCRQPVTEDGLR
jgi:hypothetical protein